MAEKTAPRPFLPCVVAPEIRQRNHAAACRRGLPWLAQLPARKVPLAIVGGGASAAEELDTLLDWPGDVLAINGAYDWLAGQGRVADWVLGVDPQPLLAGFYTTPRAATRFLIASCCDPAVFDALEGAQVQLCDIRQGDEAARPNDIPGGPSAMTRAPQIALWIGYRHIVLFGADSCLTGATTHVYGHDPEAAPIEVEAGGKTWRTTPQLLAQAHYLAELLPALRPVMRIGIAGDHLTSALLAQRGES